MTPYREFVDFLADIVEAAQKALSFVGAMSYEAFVADENRNLPSSERSK